MTKSLVLSDYGGFAREGTCCAQNRSGRFRGGPNPPKSVLATDRTVYATYVVTRLQDQENIIKATEHWKDEKTLPLPAQMFRMGAEKIQEKNLGFSYSLFSKWPINKKNKAVTDVEIQGIQHVLTNGGADNYYASEALGGNDYFTAVYPDVAVVRACINWHDDHVDSPRNDFKLGDVMGAIVIRIKTEH